ncbi:lysosomal alpha-mannosidase-like [Aethina tumida]|uniref:lysosomal alpha-mannosidase-like n=1 Tax=Aethina tumida TaxID=116153 RepID=UPI002147CE00|nr:lysosomal alpha-mannosidase-like [Aethina tumida]
MIILLIFSAFTIGVFGKPLNDACGYESCHATDPEKLNVHLIAHSHNDVGWLHPQDHSYWDEVDYIISSVVSALLINSNWRFSQTEQYYFHKWWLLQEDEVKDKVKSLINSGRLEIVNGGWCSNDEGITHYQSIIDQLTLGHRFLEEEIGECARSRVGWQIDTYGHSSTQAQIYSQMGMDSMLFSRYDFRDDENRRKSKTTDFIWTSSPKNIGNDSNIFTSAIYRAYNYPPGFCYDDFCNDKLNDLDDPTLNNIEERVKAFAEYIRTQADGYLSNNILVTMGDDMKYKNAYSNFNLMDKIIQGFETYPQTYNGKQIKLIHSTPSCYAKAVNEYVTNNGEELNVNTDDFFPLGTSGLPSYWNGYYTSRPTSKRYERIGNNLLQVSKQLAVFANQSRDENFKLESAIAVMQHHDAITGTEPEHVQKAYHANIAQGIQASIQSSSKAITKIVGLDPLTDNLELKYCPLANISICPDTKINEFNIIVYNPLAEKIRQHIQIPIDDGTWIVTDSEGNELPTLLSKLTRDYGFVAENLGVPLNTHILIFSAENIPALGFNVYNIKKTNDVSAEPHTKTVKDLTVSEKIGFKNNYVKIDVDTGFLKQIAVNSIEIDLSQEFMYYHSDYDYSGTWMFRPDGTVRDAQKITDNINVNVVEHSNIIEVRQTFNSWVTQVIRIYENEDHIEFDWTIGPIDIEDKVGKDVISRFTTNLDTGDVWYTDSNSREIVKRVRNSRPTFEINTDQEPVTQNYYPVSSRIVMKDEKQGLEFAIITDRGEGGSSLESGQLELMVHRGTLREEGDVGVLYEYEYNKGVYVRGSHYVTIGRTKDTSLVTQDEAVNAVVTQRKLAQRKHLLPWTFITTSAIPVKSLSLLNEELPPNVHLLTLAKWNDSDDTYIIRLEHLFEKGEDDELSKDVSIDLQNLFSSFKIISVQETLLNGVIPLTKESKLIWPQFSIKDASSLKRDAEDFRVNLTPMQIRTFIVKVEFN